jgi:hypothetical protein
MSVESCVRVYTSKALQIVACVYVPDSSCTCTKFAPDPNSVSLCTAYGLLVLHPHACERIQAPGEGVLRGTSLACPNAYASGPMEKGS